MNRYTIIPLMIFVAVFIGLNAHADTGTWDYLDRPYKIGKVEEISIAYDGSDQYIFAAVSSDSGKLWMSDDGGDIWSESYYKEGHWHTRVQMKPTDALFGWALVPSNDGNTDSDAGPYKTTNGGTNWNLLDGGLTNAKILHALAIDTSSTYLNTAYVGSEGNSGNSYSRLWKTTDGGQNWNLSQTGLPANDSGAVLDIKIQAGGTTLYCIYEGLTNSGVYKSTDSGANWSRITISYGGNTLSTAMAIDNDNGSLAVVEKSPVEGRIWVWSNCYSRYEIATSSVTYAPSSLIKSTSIKAMGNSRFYFAFNSADDSGTYYIAGYWTPG